MSPDPLRLDVRLLAPVLALLLLLAAGCSQSVNVEAGAVAIQPTAPTSTAAPPDPGGPGVPAAPKETEIATAKPGEVEVHLQKPSSANAKPAVVNTGGLPAIPRDGYASAGVRKIPTGFAYENPTYFKNPLVFVVLEHDGDWLHVMVAARPNGQTGWIKASDVALSKTDYRMELNLGAHHVKVFKGNDLFVETDVVIGKQASKTPLGKFFINEKIKSDNDAGAYGPWILSTSGYSEDLDIFDNGLPVIAFHGTNQPNLIGQSVSNGCIRMPNDVDRKLADALPAGTPIEITA